MGNCIDAMFYPPEKIRVKVFNGGEKEFKASTPIKKIASGPYHGYKLVHHAQPCTPLLLNTKLEPGEVYYLVPHVVQPPKMANQESCKRWSMKIVITRQQLELLLRNAKKLQSQKFAVRFSESFKEENRKWQPSLPAIHEVHHF